jgi:hypothetical protein
MIYHSYVLVKREREKSGMISLAGERKADIMLI